ncbi:chlorophyllase/cutinase-like alpha/beta fold protein [Devosia sp.]|uniref:alpha/beta hydrolase family protein n=1 Tax=Devosia sp. TaxID=1871048 RepID=UPI003267B6E7
MTTTILNETVQPVVSIAPVTIPAAARGMDLQMRVSAPATGDDLPVIIFSHGYSLSHDAYAPLVDYWAARGFVVIQPTHLDSTKIGLAPDDLRTPRIWHHREQDLLTVLDKLGQIEALVPSLQGRLDHTRIAVAGHSWGATTASMFVGATHPDPDSGATVRLRDARVKAAVLFCLAGTGGDKLNAIGSQFFPFMNPDFSAMTAPSLIVAGEKDQSQLSTVGPEWWREAFDLSPSPKMLYTAIGAEHSLGGIAQQGATMTTDESPERVAALQRLSAAYLRATLYPAEAGVGLAAVIGTVASQGVTESK